MRTAQPHFDLQPHATYRVAYNAHNRTLAGVLVVFLGYRTMPGGARRAAVRVIGTDEEYLLQPGLLISF